MIDHKKMRPGLALIAGGLACTLAQAQAQAPAKDAPLTARGGNTSVTLYGLIEPTISVIDHSTSKSHVVNYQQPWFSASRLGFTGSHEFGEGGFDGLAGIFKLEAEYVPQNGAQGSSGVLFNRDAWAGLQSPMLGKLTFGRQDALGRDISAPYGDPYGSAKVTTEEGGYTNQNNFKQLVTYGGSATGSRMDNGIVWKKAWDMGLVAGVGMQFGGTAGNLQRGQTKSVGLGWNADIWHVSGFYTNANVAGRVDRAWSVGGNVDFGAARIGGGWYQYTGNQGAKLASRTDHAWTLNAKVPVGRVDFTAGYVAIQAHNAGLDSGGNQLNPFSDSTPATKIASGDRDTIYGAVMYHFDKTSDVYLAADHLKLTSGYRVSSAPGQTSQNEVAVGLRYKF